VAEANLLLEELLTHASMSHAQLAREIVAAAPKLKLSYDHASVARWIRDHATPRDPAPAIICQILSDRLRRPVMLADIGMGRHRGTGRNAAEQIVAETSALWHGEARGRAALSLLTGPHASAPVWEWASPPHVLDLHREGRAHVDPADIALLRQLRMHYQEMYRRVGGEAVRPLLSRALIRFAAPLLRSAYDNDLGRKLFRAAGGLAALAGVCAYDADRQPLGQRHLFTALKLAKAAGDRALGAYVVALLANQTLYLDDRILVVQYAEAALRNGGSALPAALITDLHALAGKAYARMGQTDDCYQHLRQSAATAGRVQLAPADAEISYVQPGLVETQAAEALRRLGDLTAAEEHALESVRTAPATHPRGQVHRYAGLALVLTGQGRTDEAAAIAEQMLARAEGMESGRIHDRVAQVVAAMRPHAGDPAVAAFFARAEHYLRLRGT
jgi:tetratricopeptide (TPR) repeat protein